MSTVVVTTEGAILNNLAIGCLFLLAGRARAVFPTTSRSGPSGWVHILKRKGADFLDLQAIFPMSVGWERWQRAVVPVLEDDRWQMNNRLIQARIRANDVPTLVGQLEAALVESHRAAGFIP